MKKILLHQYQGIVDKAAASTGDLVVPDEGWIRTLRKALGMSGAQLARRLGVSRSQVAQSEKNELSGAITLKTLRNMAQAMGGRVVHTIVLPASASELVHQRAREKARQILQQANTHMALESQVLDKDNQAFELRRLEQELLEQMPADFWDDV
ncbi:MAG: mobile mystery protein A [Pseudomonadales bacterium]|nr:mobile mystery protein A [Pseudomonadales bacterium]